MARTPNKNEVTLHEGIEMPHEAVEAANVLATVQTDYSDERDLVNQLLGQVQMARSFSKFADVVSLTKLKHIKENKIYRALAGKKGIDLDGNEIADVGNWDGFCQALGLSRSKVDEDLTNLTVFGEDALKQLSAVGAGYRELRQFRKLPEDQKTALIEVAKEGDKDSLLELAEELIAKHSKEKEALQQQVHTVTEELEASRALTADKESRYEKLFYEKSKLDEQLQKRVKTELPEDSGEALRKEATMAATSAEMQILGPLKQVFSALMEHSEKHSIPHDEVMTGLLCQIERAANQLRAEFLLETAPRGDAAPAWLTDPTPEVERPDWMKEQEQ